MTAIVARRLLFLIPTLFLVSLAVFALSIPMDPEQAARVRAGGAEAQSQEQIDRIAEDLGLNDPFLVRYGRWVSDAVRLDLGNSFVKTRTVQGDDGLETVGVSVTDEIGRVAPRTLSVAGAGLVVGLVIGISVGVASGLRPGSLVDRLTVGATTLGIAMPSFWVAMLLVSWLAIGLGWLPAVSYVPPSAGIGEWLRHLILPGFGLGLFLAAVLARQLRAAVIDVMGSPYIRTAWAKGGTSKRVVVIHALKNAAIPPVTILGLQIASLLSGTVVIEEIFGIEGLGTLTIQAVKASDLPILQGVILLFVVVNVLLNLIVDIVYGFLNPRMRLT
jgi:peptide/nickel transport system permease protein